LAGGRSRGRSPRLRGTRASRGWRTPRRPGNRGASRRPGGATTGSSTARQPSAPRAFPGLGAHRSTSPNWLNTNSGWWRARPKGPLWAPPSRSPRVGLSLASLSSARVFGPRRSRTLPIRWPGGLASAARFPGRRSRRVSTRPLWLAEAAYPVIARSPVTSPGRGTAARRRSRPRGRRAVSTRQGCRFKRWCGVSRRVFSSRGEDRRCAEPDDRRYGRARRRCKAGD
jgi:hypothetical protein